MITNIIRRNLQNDPGHMLLDDKLMTRVAYKQAKVPSVTEGNTTYCANFVSTPLLAQCAHQAT